jgi:hypothetical protein
MNKITIEIVKDRLEQVEEKICNFEGIAIKIWILNNRRKMYQRKRIQHTEPLGWHQGDQACIGAPEEKRKGNENIRKHNDQNLTKFDANVQKLQ